MKRSMPGSEDLKLIVPPKRISPKGLQNETIIGIVDRLFNGTASSYHTMPTINSDLNETVLSQGGLRDVTLLRGLPGKNDISILTKPAFNPESSQGVA
jgi:hypothetical protein